MGLIPPKVSRFAPRSQSSRAPGPTRFMRLERSSCSGLTNELVQVHGVDDYVGEDRGQQVAAPQHEAGQCETGHAGEGRPGPVGATGSGVQQREQYRGRKPAPRPLNGAAKEQLFGKTRQQCQGDDLVSLHRAQQLRQLLFELDCARQPAARCTSKDRRGDLQHPPRAEHPTTKSPRPRRAPEEWRLHASQPTGRRRWPGSDRRSRRSDRRSLYRGGVRTVPTLRSLRSDRLG